MLNLQKIKELDSKRTQGEWELEKTHMNIESSDGSWLLSAGSLDDAAFIATLVNTFPDIVKELEAGRELAKAISTWDNPRCPDYDEGCFSCLVYKLLDKYNKAIE